MQPFHLLAEHDREQFSIDVPQKKCPVKNRFHDDLERASMQTTVMALTVTVGCHCPCLRGIVDTYILHEAGSGLRTRETNWSRPNQVFPTELPEIYFLFRFQGCYV